MKKILFLFLVLSFYYAPFSYCEEQSEYEKTCEKLFDVSGVKQSMINLTAQQFSQTLETFESYKTIFSETTSPEFWDDLMLLFVRSPYIDDLVMACIPLYAKYYTQDELEELISFYQTPLGQKFVKNNSLFIKECDQVGQMLGKIAFSQCILAE